MNERHAYRLIRDLFDHKDAIFGELKRQSSSLSGLGGPGAIGPNPRARAVSSTESNRRMATEARQKAIAERTRDKSPAAMNRHRRDKSTDGSMGRFPVVASPTIVTGQGQGHVAGTGSSISGQTGGPHRHSLEVPGSQDNGSVMEKSTKVLPNHVQNVAHSQHNETETTTNGTVGTPGGFSEPPTPPEKDIASKAAPSAIEADVEKKNSLKRNMVGSGGRGKHRGGAGSGGPASTLARGKGSLSERQSLAKEASSSPQGVTLEDKPMDD